MKKSILIFLFLVAVKSSMACINEYITLINGEVYYSDGGYGRVSSKVIDSIELRNKSEKLFNCYQRTNSIETYSDYAAALVYLGEYEEAKDIYLEIEKRAPNLYTTASNLGTIYELTGKVDSALIWIKKSVELNPKSHRGSEWIHIKILEYKLSKNSNIQSSILALDFGNEKLPANPNKYDLDQLHEHIWHQLSERTSFVKPKNEIVGNIYFDLGNILAQTRNLESALESYEAAKEYGFQSELMNQRVATLEKMTTPAKIQNAREESKNFIMRNFEIFFWTSLSVITAIFLILVRMRRKIRK